MRTFVLISSAGIGTMADLVIAHEPIARVVVALAALGLAIVATRALR